MRVAGQYEETRLGRDYAGLMVAAYYYLCAQRLPQRHAPWQSTWWVVISANTQSGFWYEISERDTTDVSQIPILRSSLLSIVHVYSVLLKAAIDNRDLPSFKVFGGFLDGLWDDMHFGQREMDIDMLRWDLSRQEGVGASTSEKGAFTSAFGGNTRGQRRTLRRTRLVWFGIGAWLLRELRSRSSAA